MKRITALMLMLVFIFSFSVFAEEEVTISYASWADPEIEEEMVNRFMEEYPHINVEIDDSIDWPWNESLGAAASAGNLPDVFYVFEIPVSVQNEWVNDISPYYDADPETDRMYEDMADTAVYDGGRYAVPSFQFPLGVYINKTLFEEYNIEIPSYDWTLDDMYNLAIRLTNPADDIFGIQGTNFHEHWPAVNNHDLGWNAYDGEKFRFTSSEWIDAYNTGREMRTLGVDADALTDEEREEIFGDAGANPFVEGNVAMNVDYSWFLPTVPEMEEEGAGEIAFYPYPGGEDGQSTYVVTDYIGMSSVTEHPEEAYKLMKFMTFGETGMMNRMDIYEERGMDLADWPVANHEEVWARIEADFDVEGISAVADTLDNTFVDVFKWLPGVDAFHGYAHEEEVWDRLDEGSINAADLAPEMEQRSYEIFQEARQLLQDALQ